MRHNTYPLAGTMFSIRPSRPADGDRVVTIWRDAVDATHHFLTAEDRCAIDAEVQQFLPQSPLWLAVDQADRAIGFMGLAGSHMEALFIDPAFHGIGIGSAMVAHALGLHPASRPMSTSRIRKRSAFTSGWALFAPDARRSTTRAEPIP